MKIAVQLFGHLRTFRECFPYLSKHLLEQYDCDVFMHTWNFEDHIDPTWHSQAKNSISKEVIESDIINLYHPKRLLIEDNNLVQETGSFGTHEKVKIGLRGIKSMLYSKQAVNKLRNEYQSDNNIKYDYVIVLRPDILLLNDINFEQYINEFEFNSHTSIHFFKNMDSGYREDKFYSYPQACDVFYFSTPNNIDTISGIINKFDVYYKDILAITPKGVENPETSFYEYCVREGVLPRMYRNYFVIKRQDNAKNVSVLPSKDDAERLSIIIPDELKITEPKSNSKTFSYMSYLLSKLSFNSLIRLEGRLKMVLRVIESRKYDKY